MAYELFIGDRVYSSWSLRGWLLFRKFGIACRVHMVGLYAGTMQSDLEPVAPARLVPSVRLPDGTPVGESIAIAETLAERHPDAGLWPNGAPERATARWLCAEMASGFGALRDACPMQLMRCYEGFEPSEAVLADLARIEMLWAHARSVSGSGSGWLFGAVSAADVFYAPVVARIAGYGLPVSAAARAYCDHWLADADLREWRRLALEEHPGVDPYALNLPATDWPEP